MRPFQERTTRKATAARHLWLCCIFAVLWSGAAVALLSQELPDRFAAATDAFQRRQFREAESLLRDALAKDPQRADGWKVLGVVYAAQGMHDLASEPFEKACRLNEREPDACYFLARNHYLRNRFDEALELFIQLRKAARRDWRYHNGAGLALSGLGRYREAEQAFREAIRYEQGGAVLDEKPAINLGTLYLREGNAVEALRVLSSVTRDHPAASRAWFEQGKAALQLDQLEDAAMALRKAVRARPDYVQAHLLLAKIYTRLGEHDKAEQHRRTAGIR